MRVRLLYFASLADRAGCPEESVDTQAADPAALYDAVRLRHNFSLGREHLRVAVNGQIVEWDHALNDGDEIVFLPPVSGG
ncbi:MAG: molybdopterin converting factor subunit 1 [Dokdonella sp.]|jgi:molybdopterin converting factor subunit 1|uniref:molybdopterin converting factor subunit 1 n=1 Tax=Dokdonella sp. TaxID=2291710 RepID=UPI002D093863|nr:molybdopterin converting factor subunit 1 [Dokdonella sp.]HOX71013.1 molybdopterin converting factor subunit 1 [Dokdonella sp.]HPG94988.1 molybdopterin converting factor subunit 1 [Dokdonella sp.]HPN79052.1 molybdopterin converting factor subunit 1 [Dokdonella sp.]